LKYSAWLPVQGVRYGIIYGEPIVIRTDVDENAVAEILEREFMAKMVELHTELVAAMGFRGQSAAHS
jgi:hypothetical protein